MAACTAKNRKGERCGAPPLNGSRPPRCWAHAGGKIAEQRAEARRQGGRSRMRQVDRPAAATTSAPLRLDSRTDAVRALSRVAAEVWQGKLDPRSANAITGAVQAALRPGLLDPSGTFEEFFSQFESITIEIGRGEEGTSECFGVMPNGTKVLLTGALADAASQRAAQDGVSLEFDDEESGTSSGGVGIEIRRARAGDEQGEDDTTH